MYLDRISLIFLSLSLVSISAGEALAIKGDVCKFADANGELLEAKIPIYVKHQTSDVLRKYDRDCDGTLNATEAAEKRADENEIIRQIRENVQRAKAFGKGIHIDANGDPDEPIFDVSTPAPARAPSNFYPYLRDSNEEVGVFKDPKPFESATGASFSYSRDGVVSNTSWAAKGVAGLAYTWSNTTRPETAGTPYAVGYAAASWVSFNWLSNSAAALKSRQTDVLSLGTTGEVAFANILDATQYFRVKGAYNTDFEGSPHSWSTTLEWQPVSNRTPLKLSAPFDLGPYLVGRLDPIVRFQHTVRQSGSLDPIFSLHDEVSRVGPVLVLNIQPKASNLILPAWIQNAALNVTYEWLQDIDTRQKYELLNSALSFPIDSSGHLAFKLNYQKGRIEETGARIDQAMAGLSAKW
ncbi:MAG: hypothetical protein JWQ94_1741 [Tardiphaga sp.]|jgi:hypothetical protein|nr:hypothetical protein [Tardiphaga sp.]